VKSLAFLAPLASGCLLIASCIGPALVITQTELPNAAEGTPYNQLLETGAGASVVWSISDGTLPPGLSLTSMTGQISGTPTADGTYTFTVSARSRAVPPRSGQQAYTLTVIDQLLLDATLDVARLNEAYDQTLDISGGIPPYTVEVKYLPGGLDYDATTGRIFGTPLNEYASGVTLQVSVTDSGDPQQSIENRQTTLVVKPPGVSITTETLDAATIGDRYSTDVEATGGVQPFTWSVTAGVLPGSSNDPDPFRLNRSTGRISGTPTTSAATSSFTLQVEDADSPASTATREFKLVIGLLITTDTLSGGNAGQSYEQTLQAAGGLPPYTWSRVSGEGELPAGLTLASSTGVISGTLTGGATTQTFEVEVTDSDSPALATRKQLTIQVSP
jgi:hypothetical protein